MTICKNAVDINGIQLHYKSLFEYCLDKVQSLFTELGTEPSVEECEAVDNKIFQRIEKRMWKIYAG